jgi:CDP-paratose 2-epimerase
MTGINARASSRTRPVLITGGAGFIGCNLADRLAREGYQVLIFDVLSRQGAEKNLTWLKQRHPTKISVAKADVRNFAEIARAAEGVQAIFHLAAQVAVTTSLVDPQEDCSTNTCGTLAVLEAVRQLNPAVPVIYASTNKVYGDLAELPLKHLGDAYAPKDPELRRHGIAENQALNFCTPYGCSKGAADQYVLDYARTFGLHAAVLRMSCIYGPHQRGTEDQGWVAHFIIRALSGEPITIYGDGCQIRDIMFVDDAVEAYFAAWRRIHEVSGCAFNLGGGPHNAISLLRLITYLEEKLSRSIAKQFRAWRAADQRYYVSDIRRAQEMLALPQPKGWRSGIDLLLGWLNTELADNGNLSGAARTRMVEATQ